MHSLCFKFVSNAAKGAATYINTLKSQKKKHNSSIGHYLPTLVRNNSYRNFNTMPSTGNGTPTPTSLVDELLSLHPLMKVKDKPRVESLLKTLLAGGFEKLQLVVDFDHTLTRTKNEQGHHLDCSWGVLENSPLLSEDYTKECGLIKAKYLPIEHDPHMSIEQKIPYMVQWYTEANRALQKSGVHKNDFRKMVEASNVQLRDGSDLMLKFLVDAGIPVLILSAGVGDLILEILKYSDAFHPNLKVVSNFLAYDESGHVTGLDGDIIHVYNKNENAIHDSDYFKVLQSKHNVILLGDSLGDLQMADGIEHPEAVLKIGFLNTNIEERIDTYMSHYDIVLADDQTMNLPLSIIKKIGEKSE